MNTQIHQPQSSGNTVAFLFGAIFNILANTDYGSLVDYALKAVIGGVIWLLFKIIGDYITNRLAARRKVKKPRKNVNSKWIWLGAGGLALAVGVPYFINLNRLSNELETVTKVSIYKLKLDGLELKIEVLLKNPTKGSITLKYPFVKMMSEGKVFATSEVRDQDITLKEFSQTVLPPIFVNLSWINLATTLPSLLKKIRSNEPVTIQVKTITTINGSVPYSKEEDIVIGKNA